MADATPSTTLIYGLLDPRQRDTPRPIRYVGKTIKPEQRLYRHILHAADRKTHLHYWILGLLADGVRPVMVELATVKTEDAGAAEVDWITRLRAEGYRLVNTATGGLGGRTLTPEARRERSERMRQRWQDPEYRQRMSRVHTGKTHGPEARRKVGEASRQAWAANPERREQFIASRLGKPGRVLTSEAKQRISAALIGRPWNAAQRAAHERRRSRNA